MTRCGARWRGKVAVIAAVAVVAMWPSGATGGTPRAGDGISGGESGPVRGRAARVRTAATEEASIRNLRLLGSTDLGGGGRFGDVTVVGDVAVVGSGWVQDSGWHTERYLPATCQQNAVHLVDISDPANPTQVATIPLAAGVAALDVDALEVSTPFFTGTLLAVALDDGEAARTCVPSSAFTHRGVAYYDITNPASPALLGRYEADAELAAPDAPPCGLPPEGGNARCATSQHSVELAQRPDGTVISLSTEPVAAVRSLAAGDLRIVDVTNPAAPTQVGAWPPVGDDRPASQSDSGCRTFNTGHDAAFAGGATRALLAYKDAGVYALDIANPATPLRLGRFTYPSGRTVEGEAGHVTFASVGGRDLALVGEKDFVGVTSTLRVDAPASIAGTKVACEAFFTLFDPQDDVALYRQPGQQLAGEFVYVGRGCPARTSGGVALPEDPYLGDPAGKIAVTDLVRTDRQPGIAATGCTFIQRMQRAEAAGAIGMLNLRVAAPGPLSSSPSALSGGGDPGPAGLTIPMVQIDQAEGDALRDVLCPSIDAEGNCTGGQPATGALVDAAGEWGGLRILDISDPATPLELGRYLPPTADDFPPPDLGIYTVGHAQVRDRFAYVTAHADGLRVLDLLDPANPVEVASFVPADAADPSGKLPSKTHVQGIAFADDGTVAVSDTNSGLYLLEGPLRVRHARSVGLSLRRHLFARGEVAAEDDFRACEADVPVRIQRRSGDRWVTVATTETGADGAFRTRIRDRSGVYRAKVSEQRMGTDPREICLAARSSRVRHRH